MTINIKLQNFEGPFDLLFHLIEKNEVDIYDIPIADITNQYLEYIYEMESLDLEVASEFIVMAATLLQIKSKMLLPKQKRDLDELAADDDEDPRAELVEKLIEYKKYKEVSNVLQKREDVYSKLFYKDAEIIDDIEEKEIFLNITLDDIVAAFTDILDKHIKDNDEKNALEEQIEREEFTVDEKIDYIEDLVKYKEKIYFTDLFPSDCSKAEVIVSFLALLELIKDRKVKFYQSKTFSDIIIECL